MQEQKQNELDSNEQEGKSLNIYTKILFNLQTT